MSGCASDPPAVVVPPPVPADLLRPCRGPSLAGVATVGALSDALVAYDRALGCANGKLEAIGEIVGAGE
ncbi:Rz1-like lysis system protein LysC [Haematobacter massiliensis]|uniref:Rz1-like lysis system protein LysC n=1 Tax=Haematobacter massiliensis TaxID=195105 RepID=UPI0023F21908|nr:hypothetical protein [Haematobacter massiliensis]